MPEKIDKSKLANFGNLELLAKQVVEGFITGLHKSPFHGFSVEFAEHRLYNSGESTKHIDWKLYARTDKVFTKKYEEETNLRCQIILDVSPSMYFPKDKKNKLEFSVYSAASLIELLRRQRDAVGLSLFDQEILLHTPSKSSTAHHNYLYSELEKVLKNYEPSNQVQKNRISDHLHAFSELCHQRSLVIIFSDLLMPQNELNSFYSALSHLKHNKHEVIVFHVMEDEFEMEFNLENRPYQLIDMETGEKIKMLPGEFKSVYQESMNNFLNEIKIKCGDYQIDYNHLNTSENYQEVLLQYLIKRSKLF